MTMKKSIILGILIGTLMGCAKEEESSIVGKWYYASKDTKIEKGAGCDLKDTTYTYTKSNTTVIYEFKSDKTFIVTAAGSSFSGQGTYTFSNNILTINTVGNSPQTAAIQNLNGDGWRILQKNYVWCPAKTAFDEFINYKKY
jgi:hypothetical protein